VTLPSERWLDRFEAHLERVVGAAPSTRQRYRPILKIGIKIGTGHLLGANPLSYRMDDSNSWRSVHQVGET
jgi:hypothetical protein